jgi:biotin carboxyl carrier protein
MRTYIVQVAGLQHAVQVDGDRVVQIDGSLADWSLLQTDRHQFTLHGSEGTFPLAAVRDEQGFDLVVRGVRLRAGVQDEREHLRRSVARAAPSAGTTSVRSPMPAMVVRVEVRPGDTVEQGQILVVMEAMKMENDVRSPASGTVEQVHVAGGTSVEKDQILLTIR